MLPVEPSALGAFVIAATAPVMSLGPDTMIILRHTLASDRKYCLAAVASAAYLAWLGLQSLRDSEDFAVPQGRATGGWARVCRDWAVSNNLDLKVIRIFLALFPSFIETERGDVTAQLVILSLVLIPINVLSQAAHRLGRRDGAPLARPGQSQACRFAYFRRRAALFRRPHDLRTSDMGRP